jgi:hypothetical protein
MAPRESSGMEPQILEMPSQKIAVVRGKGRPEEVFSELMPALYSSVYTLKFDLKKRGLPTFKVSRLRARYPDAHLVPMEEWTHIIGLPIPEDTEFLSQKVLGTEVRIENWEYGTIAQILHLGSYDQEGSTIECLKKFIEDTGYQINGVHEEEYLTRPDAKVVKTLIRYPVKTR